MCVIITGTKTKPSLVELLAAEDQNPDGGGMAWCTPQGVEFRKGLTAAEIHERLRALPRAARWVAHFRYATVGDPQVGLCHPFPVDRDTGLDAEGCVDRVLFHNGTVPDWMDRLKDITLDPTLGVEVPEGEWSDSRAVAWLLALNGSTRPLTFIEGKFVAMNRRGIRVYPQSKAGWSTQGGILYSNTYWRRRIPKVVAAMEPQERQQTLPLLDGRRGTGFGRSIVDEALDLLGDAEVETEAMDLPKPTPRPRRRAKAKKKAKSKKKAAPRKGLGLRQER